MTPTRVAGDVAGGEVAEAPQLRALPRQLQHVAGPVHVDAPGHLPRARSAGSDGREVEDVGHARRRPLPPRRTGPGACRPCRRPAPPPARPARREASPRASSRKLGLHQDVDARPWTPRGDVLDQPLADEARVAGDEVVAPSLRASWARGTLAPPRGCPPRFAGPGLACSSSEPPLSTTQVACARLSARGSCAASRAVTAALVQPVARVEPGPLHRLGRRDEHHPVHAPVQPVLDEQRRVVEDHRHARPGERLGAPRHLLAIRGGRWPRARRRSAGSAKTRAPRASPGPAARSASTTPGKRRRPPPARGCPAPTTSRATWSASMTCGAQLAEHRAHGALARGDAAGEPDHPHQRGRGRWPERAFAGAGRGAV